MKKQALLVAILAVFCTHDASARWFNHTSHKHYKKHVHTQTVKPKALIWDVGGTMMTIDTMAMIKYIGLGDAISLFFKHGFSCSTLMKDTIFDILETSTYCNDPQYPCDPYGVVLPQLMVEWFLGNMQGAEILNKIEAKIEQYDFEDKCHKRITLNALKCMFDPEIVANRMKPIRSTAKLLRECACVKDKNGSQLHSFHILSNWGDVSSFEAMMNKRSNQCIFNYFEPKHIYVSSVIHDIKPHTSAFQFVLEHEHLKPEDCIFFDDQDDNINAARKLGITAIKLTSKNSHHVRKQLKKLGVLPSK